MNKTANNEESFIEGLKRVSKRVEKMPEWKKVGWAILDDKSLQFDSPKETKVDKSKDLSSNYRVKF
jgi:hypothetical protein